jgi:prohibitin 2
MNPNFLPKLIGVAVVVFILVILAATTTYVVDPGTRGIKVTLGKTADQFLPEGFGFKSPFITTIVPVNIRQKTESLSAACFSSDLQQVAAELRVLYRVPEKSVVQIYKEFAGDPFDSLIAPRVQEAIKEVTALQTAEQIVKNREEIKQKSLASAKLKIGEILWVEDIVIRNISLLRRRWSPNNRRPRRASLRCRLKSKRRLPSFVPAGRPRRSRNAARR